MVVVVVVVASMAVVVVATMVEVAAVVVVATTVVVATSTVVVVPSLVGLGACSNCAGRCCTDMGRTDSCCMWAVSWAGKKGTVV